MTKLTNAAVENAKPKEGVYKLFDGGGLYVEVHSKGGRYWRYKYRFEGSEKRISLGVFPDVSLKDARKKHLDMRRLVANGIDPSAQKQAMRAKARSAVTFGDLTERWYKNQLPGWGEAHSKRVRSWIDRYLSGLKAKRVDQLTPQDVMRVLQTIEARGSFDTISRVNKVISTVLASAVRQGLIPADFSAGMYKDLPRAVRSHRAAIVEPKAFGELLRAIDEYTGSHIVVSALKLMANVFVRAGELRRMEWTELDFEKRRWIIPASKMKMRNDHLVPLSRQSLELINGMRCVSEDRQHVFPNHVDLDRPMSDGGMLMGLRRIGYGPDQMSVHGFRAAARTLLDEELRFPLSAIERQLAHTVRDPTGEAYNRTSFLETRTRMMSAWSSYLEQIKTEGYFDA